MSRKLLMHLSLPAVFCLFLDQFKIGDMCWRENFVTAFYALHVSCLIEAKMMKGADPLRCFDVYSQICLVSIQVIFLFRN